jgi:hypothetical protein
LLPLVPACYCLLLAAACFPLVSLGVACCRLVSFVVAFCLLSLAVGKCLSLVVACRLLLLLVSTRNFPFTHVSRPLLSSVFHLSSLVSRLQSFVSRHSSPVTYLSRHSSFSDSSHVSVLSPVVFLISRPRLLSRSTLHSLNCLDKIVTIDGVHTVICSWRCLYITVR